MTERTLLEELQARGLVNQMTGGEELQAHLEEGGCTLYCGFDPTADSLHLGHLVPLLVLRRFQEAGHRPIALVGGATGLIGDPSFKAAERQLNTPDVVAGWADKIRSQVSRFIRFDAEPNPAVVVNNLDWTAGLNVLDFLRDVGKHFSVNAMINKESVQQRLNRDGEGISFTEFSYALLQGMDFAELNRRYDCSLQIGGSDQWGNIVGGIDLCRRQNQRRAFGLTVPLVIKADGTKFGKTESGAVWLDALKTSPFSFYQFWINTADADVYKFLKYFTFLSIEAIAEIEAEDKRATGRPQAQGVLAQEVTRLVHGDEGLAAAQRIASALFSGDVSKLQESDFVQLAQDGLPTTVVATERLGLLEALVETGIAVTPRGEVTIGQARKFVQEGAIAINGEKIGDIEAILSKEEARFGRFHLIRRGKKQFCLIDWR